MAMNKPEVVFSNEFPSPAVAIVPEYFSKDSIEGMAPGSIVYPYDFDFLSDVAMGFFMSNLEVN